MTEKKEETKPLYAHDCELCQYVGQSVYQFGSQDPIAADVYYCQNQGKHIGKEECILVRWSEADFGFGYFPYFVFYLASAYVQKESEEGQQLLVPYLFGLKQAQAKGLLQPKKE